MALAALAGCGDQEGISRTQLAAPAPALAEASTLTLTDASTAAGFLEVAAVINLYEAEATQVALLKSRNPAVRAYAEELSQSQAAASETLKKAALAAGAPLPTSVDYQKRAWLLALLNSNVSTIDAMFLDQQRRAMDELSRAGELYLRSGADEDLSRLARDAAAVARLHLSALDGLAASPKLASSTGAAPQS